MSLTQSVRRVLVLTASCAAGLGFLASAAAAQQTTNAGEAPLKVPGPATEQPLDFKNLDIPRLPAPPLNGASELDGTKLWNYVNDISRFSYLSRDAGQALWGRLAGEPGARLAIDYVEKELKSAGLAVERWPVKFERISHPDRWHVRLVGAESLGVGNVVELKSAVPMSYRPASTGRGSGRWLGPRAAPLPPAVGTLSAVAEMAYVGEPTSAAVASRSVKGKIAVFNVEPAPVLFHMALEEGVDAAIQAGAVGVIAIYNMPGNMQARYGACSAIIPCFILGGEDGRFLREAVRRASIAGKSADLKLDLSANFRGKEELTAEVLLVKISGTEGRENIVINAHSDGYFAAANDNGSGASALIGLAKHFSSAPKLKNDLYFFLSAGHHHATGGSGPLVDKYPNLPTSNIVLLNIEHVGQVSTYRSYMRDTDPESPQSFALYLPATGDSLGREVTMLPADSKVLRDVWTKASTRNGLTQPATISGPAVAEPQPWMAAGGNAVQHVETSVWYHTSGDTPESVSPEAMQRVALFYKDFITSIDGVTREDIRAGTK